jgi:hypothetical protein
VVKLGGLSKQASLNVAQAFTIRQLRKCHDSKLSRAGQCAHPMIAAMPSDDAMEVLPFFRGKKSIT